MSDIGNIMIQKKREEGSPFVLVDGVKHPVLPAMEVARQRGCFEMTVYRAIEKGDLTGYQVGKTWLVVNDAKLDAWTPPRSGRPKTVHRRPQRSRKMKEEQG
jgi:excisionase family DNA binding protein